MDKVFPHRKRVKHYDEPGHAHLLTFSCFHQMPLLTNNLWRKWLSEAIDIAVDAQRFHLVAFVYMPEHVHVLVWPTEEEYHTGKLLWSIKRPFSSRIKGGLQEQRSPLLGKLTVRERPGKSAFRFWQEGGGHDRNLVELDGLATVAEYIHNNPVRRGLVETPDKWKWSSGGHSHRPDEPADPDLPRVHGFPG